jgi:hypothetical protein
MIKTKKELPARKWAAELADKRKKRPTGARRFQEKIAGSLTAYLPFFAAFLSAFFAFFAIVDLLLT